MSSPLQSNSNLGYRVTKLPLTFPFFIFSTLSATSVFYVCVKYEKQNWFLLNKIWYDNKYFDLAQGYQFYYYYFLLLLIWTWRWPFGSDSKMVFIGLIYRYTTKTCLKRSDKRVVMNNGKIKFGALHRTWVRLRTVRAFRSIYSKYTCGF